MAHTVGLVPFTTNKSVSHPIYGMITLMTVKISAISGSPCGVYKVTYVTGDLLTSPRLHCEARHAF